MAPSQVIFMLWSFQNRYSNSYKLFKIKISKKCQNVSFGKLELFHDEDIKTDFVSTLCKLSFKNDCPNTLTYVFHKVSSVQEPCPKCFAVHISKFEILQTT